MRIFKFTVGAMGTNSYILLDEDTRHAALIDPGDDPDRLLTALDAKGASLSCIILTHGHFDHIMALGKIKEKTNAPIFIHRDDADMLSDGTLSLLYRFGNADIEVPHADELLNDGQIITVGSSEIKVLHTPGHTPGSICLMVGDDLISGDTLFRESIGRYDFPGGDYNAILQSLKKISSLKISGKIYPGHGMSTTLEHELDYNTYLM